MTNTTYKVSFHARTLHRSGDVAHYCRNQAFSPTISTPESAGRKVPLSHRPEVVSGNRIFRQVYKIGGHGGTVELNWDWCCRAMRVARRNAALWELLG